MLQVATELQMASYKWQVSQLEWYVTPTLMRPCGLMASFIH